MFFVLKAVLINFLLVYYSSNNLTFSDQKDEAKCVGDDDFVDLNRKQLVCDSKDTSSMNLSDVLETDSSIKESQLLDSEGKYKFKNFKDQEITHAKLFTDYVFKGKAGDEANNYIHKGHRGENLKLNPLIIAPSGTLDIRSSRVGDCAQGVFSFHRIHFDSVPGTTDNIFPNEFIYDLRCCCHWNLLGHACDRVFSVNEWFFRKDEGKI